MIREFCPGCSSLDLGKCWTLWCSLVFDSGASLFYIWRFSGTRGSCRNLRLFELSQKISYLADCLPAECFPCWPGSSTQSCSVSAYLRELWLALNDTSWCWSCSRVCCHFLSSCHSLFAEPISWIYRPAYASCLRFSPISWRHQLSLFWVPLDAPGWRPKC